MKLNIQINFTNTIVSLGNFFKVAAITESRRAALHSTNIRDNEKISNKTKTQINA